MASFPLNNIVEGILVNRESPFARNKGFSERFDKVFQADGYPTLGDQAPTGTSILWDVRALYGLFLWLHNISGQDLTKTELFFSYINFDKVTDLDNIDDWVAALDTAGAAFFAGTLDDGVDAEAEIVRISSKVTAVRLDIDSGADNILNGTFSAV